MYLNVTGVGIVKRVLVVAVAVFSMVGCGETEPSQELIEIKNQRVAREFVQANLKDPKSAEFRNQKSLCGEVNAKNSFGAYTGFKRFIAANEQMVVIEGDGKMPISEFNQVWNQFCK